MHTVPTLCEEGHAPVPHDYTLHYTHRACGLRVWYVLLLFSVSPALATFALPRSLLSTSNRISHLSRPLRPPTPLCHLPPCCTRVLIVYNVVVSVLIKNGSAEGHFSGPPPRQAAANAHIDTSSAPYHSPLTDSDLSLSLLLLSSVLEPLGSFEEERDVRIRIDCGHHLFGL